ncbi:hypothetical protein ACET3Z_016439 [Daucus carota]
MVLSDVMKHFKNLKRSQGKALQNFHTRFTMEFSCHHQILGEASSMMYVTRAAVYIKMKKPNTAISDANTALETGQHA